MRAAGRKSTGRKIPVGSLSSKSGRASRGLGSTWPGPIRSRTGLHTWNDLAWTDVVSNYSQATFLQLWGGENAVELVPPPVNDEAKAQYDEDVRFQWKADISAPVGSTEER